MGIVANEQAAFRLGHAEEVRQMIEMGRSRHHLQLGRHVRYVPCDLKRLLSRDVVRENLGFLGVQRWPSLDDGQCANIQDRVKVAGPRLSHATPDPVPLPCGISAALGGWPP